MDSDLDGVVNSLDNRPSKANSDQLDIDGDALGKINLADVIRLIDHVCLTKALTELCRTAPARSPDEQPEEVIIPKLLQAH